MDLLFKGQIINGTHMVEEIYPYIIRVKNLKTSKMETLNIGDLIMMGVLPQTIFGGHIN